MDNIAERICEIREIVNLRKLSLEQYQQMSVYTSTLIWLEKRDMWGRLEKEMGYFEEYVRNCLDKI